MFKLLQQNRNRRQAELGQVLLKKNTRQGGGDFSSTKIICLNGTYICTACSGAADFHTRKLGGGGPDFKKDLLNFTFVGSVASVTALSSLCERVLLMVIS
jgi:hypothetical protein